MTLLLPPSRRLLVVLAFVSTFLAATIDNVTFATNDYTRIVIAAIVLAAVALVLIAVAWRRVTRLVRGVAVFLVIVNLWTLMDAAGRRLPAILGW